MDATGMPGRPAPKNSVRNAPVLRVLATSDLHCQLLPWDHHSDRPAEGFGLSRLAALIAAARDEVPVSVLLDNGDFLTGGPLSEDLAARGALAPEAPHPMIAAMNRLRYDAVGLGNHEFSLGRAFLRDSLAAAEFPVLSANLRDDKGQPLHLPGLVIERSLADESGQRHPLRIGITSVLPPQTALWERHHLGEAVLVSEMRAAVRAEAARMRAAGADVVVALAHSGLERAGAAPGAVTEHRARAILRLPAVDAVIAGHSHEAFPPEGAASPQPIVLPGALGSHLGVIDLTLVRQGGRWRVAGSRAELRPVARRDAGGRLAPLVADDPRILEVALPSHQVLRERAAQVIGQSEGRLDSHFALVRPAAMLDLAAAAMADHVRARLPGAGVPVLAAIAPARVGGRSGPESYTDIPPGPLRMRHLCDFFPHPDRIVALNLSGSDLSDWLERSASLFMTVAPGRQDAMLIDPEVPVFTFDVVPGLTYEIDLSAPARFNACGGLTDPTARRIGPLWLNGQRLQPADRLILVTSSHRAGGGGGFPVPQAAALAEASGASLREVMRAHIADLGTVTPQVAPGWSFRPMPGTTTLFDSAAGATAPDAAIEPLGPTPGGFHRFRLHL